MNSAFLISLSISSSINQHDILMFPLFTYNLILSCIAYGRTEMCFLLHQLHYYSINMDFIFRKSSR